MKIENGNGIELSHTDRRSYRDFELPNGLKVMIISAPREDGDASTKSDTLSAAALCIRVGSFCDPEEAQGLSHLLEHMLFHGDSPTSEIKSFHDYIHERNGYWDSKTSNEHTLFYFSIPNKYFDEALTIFASHFIKPVLKRDGIRKAVEKLDMEFQKVKTRDYAKLRGFISSLAIRGSPYRLFGRGNKLSLITEPEKNDVDVYSLLKNHWAYLYSAHRMTLAVQSKDSLNTLERLVREKFANIPTNRSVNLDLTRYANSFDSPEFFKLYHVDSTRNKEQLRMVWAVPSVYSLYKSNPVAVLAYFLSDKHPYGLENYLKNNHLATEVKCEFSAMSDFENSTICALITICIDLKGTRSDLLKITKLVYQYLRFLSNKAHESCVSNRNSTEVNNGNNNNNNNVNKIQQTINSPGKSSFDSCVRDLQVTQKEAFLNRATFGPQETVIWIANMLHYTLPQDVHSAYLVIAKPDFQVYSEFLDTLSKQQACLIHSSKLNPSMHKNIHTEKWYNLQYTQEEISSKQMGCLNYTDDAIPFSLPLKVNGMGEVIVCARDYSIVSSENDMQTPVNLITEFKGTMYESYGSVWYHQINNQTTDDVYVYTHISSGMEFNDPSKACLSRLLQTSIKLRLLDLDVITKESGTEYTFKMNISGPEIIVKGPCERVYELYKQLIESTTVDFTKDHFIKCKKQLTEELTAQLSNPNYLADNLNTCLWNQNEYTAKALLHSLTYISIADLMAFHSKYFFQLEITMYVVGDMQEGLAKDLFTFTVEYFKCYPNSDQAKIIDNIPLRPGTYYHSVTNASIPGKYYQLVQYQRIENTSPLDEIYCKIIIALVKTHAQQYFQHYESLNGQVILDLYKLISTSAEQVIGTRLCLMSQSVKHDSDYLISCVNIFWQQIATRVIACAEHKAIEQIYDTINSNDAIDSSDVKQLSQFYWNKILNKNETFDGRNEKDLFKKEVSREKLLDYFYRNYLNPSKQISIFIDFRNADIQNDHQNEPSNPNKTNSTNFNANLNSYLKDEDLINLPPGTSKHLINVLNEQTPAIQITRKIENIESFRFRYKKETC